MQMSTPQETKFEKVQRLQTAYAKTKSVLEDQPPGRDLHPGTDIAQQWLVITAAYSGLEQTLKFLIAEEKGCSIEQLLKKKSYRTHDLGNLFLSLGEEVKDHAREFYRIFQSLHCYIDVEEVDDFLNIISSPDGKGYEYWRYTLIQEDNPLPTNSSEFMMAIWSILVQIVIQKWNCAKHLSVQMPDEILRKQLLLTLQNVVNNGIIKLQERCELYQENVLQEIENWLQKKTHPLNAFSDVLWHYGKYRSHGVKGASDWFSEVLTTWAADVIKCPTASVPTLLRFFVARAQGGTPDGASIRWNPEIKRFETMPWSLEKCVRDKPPPQAIVIDENYVSLQDLWICAKESGYQVLENRAFKAYQTQSSWFCALRVQTEVSGEVEPLLSIWQQWHMYYYLTNGQNPLHIVVECAEEQITGPLRCWIDSVKGLAKI